MTSSWRRRTPVCCQAAETVEFVPGATSIAPLDLEPRTINADRLRRNVAIERKSVDQSLFRVGVEAGGILTVIPQPTAREMVFAVENDGTVDDRDSGFAHTGQSAREVRRILTLPYMVP